ncbi:MAG: NDP-sugar synthase [Promethearchaeota archaeon]|nr:MAG: NDP-sugar synthase [Candidatus Lokiarchaeota archaeon]
MLLICPIAGSGRRLLPFTYSKPKAFLKIAGKRLIDHILIKLKNSFPQGTNVCFIVGYKKRQITEYLKKNHSDYFNIHFVEQKPLGYEADAPYFSGLGDAILLAKNLAENDDCFIFLSDRLPIEDYSQILLNFHQDICDSVINVKQVDNPQFYGVIELDKNGTVKNIIEKPEIPKSNYAVSGVYLFGMSITPRLFELLAEQSKIPLENGQEHHLTPVIQQLIEEGFKFKINEMQKEILDFGRPESLIAGNRLLLAEIKIQDPTYDKLFQSGNILDSKIVPPVFIGENTKITDSVIGPNISIGDNVVLDKCILSESVIGDGANLKKIISSESIIGDYSILEDLIKKSITIGDSSYITTSNMKSF